MEKYDKIALDILQQATGTDDLSEDRDLDLFEAEMLDSMSVISIIISIEKALGLRLQPTDFVKDDIKTVDNFAKFLKGKAEA